VQVAMASKEATKVFKYINTIAVNQDTALEEIMTKSSALVKVWLLTMIDEDLEYVKYKGHEGMSKTMLDKYHTRLEASLMEQNVTILRFGDGPKVKRTYIGKGGTHFYHVKVPEDEDCSDDDENFDKGPATTKKTYHTDGRPYIYLDDIKAAEELYDNEEKNIEPTEEFNNNEEHYFKNDGYAEKPADYTPVDTGSTYEPSASPTGSASDPTLASDHTSASESSGGAKDYPTSSDSNKITDSEGGPMSIGNNFLAPDTDTSQSTQTTQSWGADSWFDRIPRGTITYNVISEESGPMSIDLANNPLASDTDVSDDVSDEVSDDVSDKVDDPSRRIE
jgi:hypothetical protein